jgi:hypothetical protein
VVVLLGQCPGPYGRCGSGVILRPNIQRLKHLPYLLDLALAYIFLYLRVKGIWLAVPWTRGHLRQPGEGLPGTSLPRSSPLPSGGGTSVPKSMWKLALAMWRKKYEK